MDLTQTFWVGSGLPAHKQWVSPLFTCNMNSGEENAEEEEGGGGGKGRRLACGVSRCF